MKRILLALVAAAAFALTVGTTGTADARPYVRIGVGVGPGYGGYYGGGYGTYRPYYGNYGYRPYVGGYSTYRPYYGGYGYGAGYRPAYYGGYRPAYYGGHHHHNGRRCW